MEPTPEPTNLEKRSVRARRRRSAWSVRLTPLGLLIVFACNLTLLALMAWPIVQSRLGIGLPVVPGLPFPEQILPSPTSPQVPTDPATQTDEPSTPTSNPPTATSTLAPTAHASLQQGVIVMGMVEGNYSHIFAYQPLESEEFSPLPLTRLTYGIWDDHSPAVSPDGRWIVFTSNRNGYWDLYLLDLTTGMIERLTDTLEYENSPSWSPDGLWIVYEAYLEEDLEIFILSRENPQAPPIQLTNNSFADHSPAWSPLGRQIAFVSDRSGEPEIWLVDLDQADESQFRNLSQSPNGIEAYPSWSPDGNYLAWASMQEGYHHIMLWDSSQPDQAPRILGSGDRPAWSPDGQVVLTVLSSPNRDYLSAYPIKRQGIMIPPLAIPGALTGLDWADLVPLSPLRAPIQQAAEQTPTPLWLPVLTLDEDIPGGRRQLVEIEDVQAPYPYLQDLVDESFQALRARVASEIGWDFLGSLENAYVPLTAPLDPGMGNDWLYTGRAFSFNLAPLNAGWIVVMREDYSAQTYWRVYLRVRFQDGSAGAPLKQTPWDFNARFQGEPLAFEQGGRLSQAIPGGYWYDFTSLARAYGWERLAALSSWRASYAAGRFNEFVFSDGLDWTAAMLEIYPPEVLVTPTRIVPPSRTPTATPRFFQSPTPTLTPTPRPTLTPPLAPASPTPSPTSSRTASPTPSGTPGSATPTQEP
jgi:TolB protein